MPTGRCTNPACVAAKTGLCFDNLTLEKCPRWVAAGVAQAKPAGQRKAPVAASKRPRAGASQGVDWTGDALHLPDLELVSRRSNPMLLATVGEAAAGKSSFLGMLHTLLLRGHCLRNHTFAGSLTLLGWEKLALALRFPKGQATDQPPTPADPDYYRLLHWALRRPDDGSLLDVLFPDAAGEVFSQWAVDEQDINAENVRWIYYHADAFFFFVDCEALVEQRGAAVAPLADLASRLAQGLRGRPVLVVWSKADRLPDVREGVRERMARQLTLVFGNAPQLYISKELDAQPDPKQLANLQAVDDILARLAQRRPTVPELDAIGHRTDLFLRYRGR